MTRRKARFTPERKALRRARTKKAFKVMSKIIFNPITSKLVAAIPLPGMRGVAAAITAGTHVRNLIER